MLKVGELVGQGLDDGGVDVPIVNRSSTVQLLVADTPMKFFSPKILCTPLHSTFGAPRTKIFFDFFALIKKIFSQPPIEIFIRYFLDSLGPPYKQKEEKGKFHIWSVGYQNRVKRVRGVHSEGFFGKYSKIKSLGLTFLKRSNFEAFSGAP